ncbi:MAG: hypothetical protein NVSMB64_15390 [Candidatus Velthaea sp.]
MLNEIVRWMSERRSDRRTADRKRLQFSVGWLKGDEAVPGIGTEISLNGMLFATKRAPGVPSFNVVIELAGRRIKARLSTVRSESAMREGSSWTMLACTFEGIAADDYDAIVRLIRDLPEPENKAQGEIAAAAGSDDAYRLLPMSVQERIVRVLAEAGRLAPDSDPRHPLLRMKYLGSKAGKHRFAVHSRSAVGDEIQQFDSTFTVDETGIVTLDR